MNTNMTEPQKVVENLLNKVAVEQNFKNYKLEIIPISSGGANYTSTLFNASISEGNNVINTFVKVAAVGDGMRINTPKFFETEYLCFTKILKAYEELQEQHNVPQEHRLSYPKCYACHNVTYEETVVLEDLVKSGYQAFDRFKTFDWEYAKSAITELAKYHALSFAYNEYRPEEFNELVENFKFEWDTDSESVKKMAEKSIGNALMNIENDENRGKLLKFFQNMDPEWQRNLSKPGVRAVIGHGDFRPNNLMHKIREDGTVDIKVLDFQTLQGTNPIIDLLYFIFTGSDEQFRGQYYDKLVDYYYNQLAASMRRLNLSPEKVYSRQDFDSELKEKFMNGIIIAVFTLPVITVEEENAPVVNQDLGLESFSVQKTSEEYKQRLNGIINNYVKWGKL